jgi:hypothetical protein
MMAQEQKTPTIISGNWIMVIRETSRQGTANPGAVTFLDESTREQYVRETTTRFIIENKDLFDRLAKE